MWLLKTPIAGSRICPRDMACCFSLKGSYLGKFLEDFLGLNAKTNADDKKGTYSKVMLNHFLQTRS